MLVLDGVYVEKNYKSLVLFVVATDWVYKNVNLYVSLYRKLGINTEL